MTRFQVTTSAEPARAVVTLAGECDLAVREELISALLSAVQQAPVVVVDLAGLTFLDSRGVHGLVTAHHAARQRGGALYLTNAAGTVATVLDITGIAELLSLPGVARDGNRHG